MASAGNHRYAKALVFEESDDYNSGESNTLVCQNGILYFNGRQLSSNTGNQFDIFTANRVTRLSGANIQWDSNLVILPYTDSVIDSINSAGQGFQSDASGFLHYNGIQISAFSNIYQDADPLTSNSITPLSNTAFVINSNLIVPDAITAYSDTITLLPDTLHFSNAAPNITFDTVTPFKIQPLNQGGTVQFMGAKNAGTDANVSFVSTDTANTVGSDVVNLRFKNTGDAVDPLANHTVATLKSSQTTTFSATASGGGSMTMMCRDPTQSGTSPTDTQVTMIQANTHTTANTIVIAPETVAKVGIMAGYAPGKTFQIGSNGAENLYFDNASNTLALGRFSKIVTPSNVWVQGGGDRVTIGSLAAAGEKSVVIGAVAGTAANVVSIGFGHTGTLEANVVKIGSYSTTTQKNSVSIGYKPKAGLDGVSIGSNAGTLTGDYSISIGKDAGATSQGSLSVAIGWQAGASNQSSDAVAIGNQAGESTQGTRSVAMGRQAGKTDQGSQAVAIGYAAGATGQLARCVSIGYGAGETDQGSSSVAVGHSAALSSQQANAIAIGYRSGYFTQNAASVAIGVDAGYQGQYANSIAIGRQSGRYQQESNCIAIGNVAGKTVQGSESVAIGASAGESNQGSFAIAIGSLTGNTNQGVFTTAIGRKCGEISQGNNSTAIGSNSGNSNQGDYATAIGSNSGHTTQGDGSVAIGWEAGKTSQGDNSIAIGNGAGRSNQGDEGNGIAIGFDAAYENQDNNAIAIGTDAGRSSQGANSVAIGRKAGYLSQTAGSVAINGGFNELLAPNAGFYINPVRNDTGNASTYSLQWSTSTKEVTYDTAKTFVIDHPDDKEKYLVHGCLEGPEGGVYYRGRGEVGTPVILPKYVPNLIKGEPTIQVTPIYNGSVRTLNCSEYDNKSNSFEVFGTEGPFYWTFTAKRCDVNVEPTKAETNVSGDGPYLFTTN